MRQQESLKSRRRFTMVARFAYPVAVVAIAVTGCHDGPLYALKHANPYFTMGEWKESRALGVTDAERRKELVKLADVVDGLPEDRQRYWLGELNKVMAHDPSAEMRRLAVVSAGKINDPGSASLIKKGLEDEDLKVRMEACRALGRRGDDASASLLAATAGGDSNEDVRKAAIGALGNFQSKLAVDSLRVALRDRDPAAQQLAIASLRGATGEDHGSEPQAWIAALDAKEPAGGSLQEGGSGLY
ncbi:MAG: HEAT repeat domain-containing protein [Planctomycetota bacterium]